MTASGAGAGAGAAAGSLSCVILTMGDRPAAVARGVGAVLDQRGAPVEVVVVGNGADPTGLPDTVRTVRLATNVGIPAGRNAGLAATTGDVVLFLDDDGWLADDGAAERLRAMFAADPALGVVSFRVRDPDGGPDQRRHVPRLRAGDPHRGSEVTTFLGGACAVRRAVFERCGEFPGEFFYAHEETDLAWRALDAGFRIRYEPSVVLHHPAAPPTRHRAFYRLNARNRVWLARRHLPWWVGWLYLLDWVALTVLRVRRPDALRVWAAGFAEGWRVPCGPRRPIRLRTVLRMTRLGRPPIV